MFVPGRHTGTQQLDDVFAYTDKGKRGEGLDEHLEVGVDLVVQL